MRPLRRVLLLVAVSAVAAWGRRKQEPVEEEAVPETDGLIGILAHAVFEYFDQPKYHVAVFLTLGYRYDEDTAVYVVASLCNWLYGVLVLWGFATYSRSRMLVLVALTFPIGPSIVLIFLGALAGLQLLFVARPMASVAALWVLFFLPSQLAQRLGLWLGLDADRDGDVDVLDVLDFFAETRLGVLLRLRGVHTYLNAPHHNPFDHVIARLDRIDSKIDGGRPAEVVAARTPARQEERTVPPAST
mmetsp:Transcript_23679/g.71015  ORF Transcript_23679/g.71015 Transcript_23679/m.71015 type:complete len:245 (-) Transcript_23679:29-763(-)